MTDILRTSGKRKPAWHGETCADASVNGTDVPRTASYNFNSPGTLGHEHMQRTGQPRAAARQHGRVNQGSSSQLADPTMDLTAEGGGAEHIVISMQEYFRWGAGEVDDLLDKLSEEVGEASWTWNVSMGRRGRNWILRLVSLGEGAGRRRHASLRALRSMCVSSFQRGIA